LWVVDFTGEFIGLPTPYGSTSDLNVSRVKSKDDGKSVFGFSLVEFESVKKYPDEPTSYKNPAPGPSVLS